MTDILSPEKIERIEELATENIENVRSVVNEKLDSTSRKIAGMAEELREATGHERHRGTLENARGYLREKKQLFDEKRRHVAELASNGYVQLRTSTGELATRVRRFTRKNPLKSTAFAVGLGLVTGLAIRQARS